MNTMKCITDSGEKKMLHTLNHLEEIFSHIRAGKANTHILDGIRVEYYGNMVPLSNVAALSTPDAKTIVILPWEKTMLKIIEKAVQNSDVGITPENNGEVIRLSVPPLTEERRKILVKQSRMESENAKVSIRNTRREAIENIKKFVKTGISEDEGKERENTIQKMYEKFSKKIDEILSAKEKEIMTI